MKPLLTLMRELQGIETNGQFAARLGLSESTISYLYSGDREPGYKVARALTEAFPERAEEIKALFLAQKYNSCDVPTPVQVEG